MRVARGTWWPHHENRVAKGIDEIESARAPLFVPGWTLHGDALSPLIVVGVRVAHLQGDARFSAVTGHRTLEREVDRPSFQTQEPVFAVFRNLKANAEPQAIDVEGFRYGEIIRGKYRCGSFHGDVSAFDRVLTAMVRTRPRRFASARAALRWVRGRT